MNNDLITVYRKITVEESNNLMNVYTRIENPGLYNVYTKLERLREVYTKVPQYYCKPEVWHRISDYIPEIQSRFWISNKGNVYDEKKDKFRNLVINPSGYAHLSFGHTIMYLVHRLVMICFKYRPDYDDYLVNHKDGNKLNNDIDNLEWCTYSENMQHALTHGLRRLGEDHNRSCFTNEQVHLICQGLEQRMSYKDICEQLLKIEFGELQKWAICDIKRGNTWKHISRFYNIPETNKNSQLFTNDQVRLICECLQSGLMDYVSILKYIGIDYDNQTKTYKDTLRNMISKIKRRKRFTNISKDYRF